MTKPLVSVIIPSYNSGPLVLETVHSILQQTYQSIEIVLVDDASSDGTQERLRTLIEQKKIVYVRNEKNIGQDASRRRGLQIARGELISFIDADDLIAPEKISLQVDYLQRHADCGVCYSNIIHFWDEDRKVLLHKKLQYYEGDIFQELIKSNFIQVMTALIRRPLLEKYWLPTVPLRRSEDWHLWLALSYGGVRFCFLDRLLCFQRRQKKGTLSDQKTYFKETAETNLAVYKEFYQKFSDGERVRYRLADLINFWQFRLFLGYLILNDKKRALEELRHYQIRHWRDRIKKFFFGLIVVAIPVSWLSWLLLTLREWTKRQSFERINDPNVNLPAS